MITRNKSRKTLQSVGTITQYLPEPPCLLPYKLFITELTRNNSLREYLQYEKALCKLTINIARIEFLENCRKSDIIPKFLKFRIPNNGCFDDKAVHEFQKKLLHHEIIKAKGDRLQLQNNIDNKRVTLKTCVPSKLIPSVIWFFRFKRREVLLEAQSTHNKKLLNLSEQQEKPLFGVKNTVKVLVPGLAPPKYVMEVLSMGPKHTVLDRFDSKDVLVELDRFLGECKRKFLPEDMITDINIKTLNYIKQCNKLKSNRHISMTKRYLKDNKLLAVPFDKGIGICIMSVEMYKEKMNVVTSLPQFVKLINNRVNAKNPIVKEEERVVDALKTLKDRGKLNEVQFNTLKPIGSQPPRLYGLAKVHKAHIPMRPVLSMPGSAYYKIGKYLSKFLAKVPECTINTSTEGINESIKHVSLKKDEQLVSFDVTSLYTNVPVEESIKHCTNLLFKKFSSLPIDKDTFSELARLSSCDVVMSTHDGYYTQTDGLAMGSPLAPYLANGWLSQYDDTIAASLDPVPPVEDPVEDLQIVEAPVQQVQNKLYHRYVDDILMSISVNTIDQKLALINNLHKSLGFTIERESEGKIPFLDMLIINQEGILSSTWYSKDSATGLMMNYHALAPVKYKKSIVSGLVYRIYRSCSSWKNIDESLQKARLMLNANQYPPSFYEPIIQKTITRLVSRIDDSEKDESKKPFLVFLQYRGKCSEEFSKDIQDICMKPDSAFQLEVKVIFTLKKLKSVLPPLKEPVSKMLKSGVVYHIKCPGCETCYVGQTARHLLYRFREHVKNPGPLRDHFSTCGEVLLEENISILTGASDDERLMLFEALFIKELAPGLNTKEEFRSRNLSLKF